MTPAELGIQTPTLRVGIHQGRVIVQFGEAQPMGFDPDQATVFASLLLSNSVKARNMKIETESAVKDAVEKAYGNGDGVGTAP